MIQMNLSTKQKQTHRHREETCGCQGVGKGWIGSGISRCKLVYIEWVNKVLPYSTGNYIHYPLIKHNGKNMKKNVYICITESLWSTAVINTTLQFNYTSIKNFLKASKLQGEK